MNMFRIPPCNQGQTVEVAYRDTADGRVVARSYDRSDHEVTYCIATLAADSEDISGSNEPPEIEGEWESIGEAEVECLFGEEKPEKTRDERLNDFRNETEILWEGAQEGADRLDFARGWACQKAAKSALAEWDQAIIFARGGRIAAAKEHLEQARMLAAEWGDDTIERRALDLLRDCWI